jgi:putative ABC transport system permease protein
MRETWLATCMHDFRYGFLKLWRSPAFTLISVATLGLGIGVNTVIFSLVNSEFLQPLPFPRSDRLVQIWETETAPGQYPVSGQDYLDWSRRDRSFESMTLYSWGRTCNASGAGSPEPVSVIGTQANFFELVGIAPLLGRGFTTGDDSGPGHDIAVLSYGFWQRHFGLTPVIGTSLALDGEAYEIVGVMPKSFAITPEADLWIPLNMTAGGLGARGSHQYRVLARLKQNTTVGQAQAQFSTVSAQLEHEYPQSNAGVGARLVPLRDELTGQSRSYLFALTLAVALILIIACSNVANLSLAKASRRQQEIVVRAALGEARRRLVQRLLAESIVLSLLGGTVAILVALFSIRIMQLTNISTHFRPIYLDYLSLAFTLAVSVFVSILCGFAPMLHTSDETVSGNLRSGARSGSLSRRQSVLRDCLITGEVTLALALMVAAGLLMRSVTKLRAFDIGIQTRNILAMGIQLPPARYETIQKRRDFYDQTIDSIKNIPGIEAAAVSSELPLEGVSNGFVTLGGGTDPALTKQLVEWNYITSEYFHVFGIQFLSGRNFTPDDTDHIAEITERFNEMQRSGKISPAVLSSFTLVAIINRRMARTYWPNESALGQTFKLSGVVSVRVIGIVGDVNESGIRQSPIPQAYFPLVMQLDRPAMTGHLAIKAIASPSALLPLIRARIATIDGSLALFAIRRMNDIVEQSIGSTGTQSWLLTIFAGLALVMSATGIFGVVSYLTSTSTYEIGVRMALGATPNRVLGHLVWQGGKLILMGLVAGVLVALGLGRVLSNEVFGITTSDPPTFVAAIVALGIVAVLSCYVPARRATRVDPVVALRHE